MSGQEVVSRSLTGLFHTELPGGSSITGSSPIWWGSGGEAAGGEEHAEAVVVSVAVAAGEAAVELDDAVDRLGTAVR